MSKQFLKNTESRTSGLRDQTLSLHSESDLIAICEYAKSMAAKIGFDENGRTVIETALTEIGRNVIEYAGHGEVFIKPVLEERKSIMIEVKDCGPGIDDVEKALEEGFSSSKGLGIGLPGAKRIMDEFTIKTSCGEGTVVRMVKWLNQE